MTTINETVRLLSARLPELAWKLGALDSTLNPKLLPRGLFNYQFEMTPQSCIDEINENLQAVKNQTNERSAHYLAERIHQKINVLVRLCHLRGEKKSQAGSMPFGVQAINTRQQWLQTLQDDIASLNAQQQALQHAFLRLQGLGDSTSILSLQAELGEIERRLTLANETLMRATA